VAASVRQCCRPFRATEIVHEFVVVGKGIKIGKHGHLHADAGEEFSRLAKFALAKRREDLRVACLDLKAELPCGACRDDLIAWPLNEQDALGEQSLPVR
jgi:hypothetical protein